MERDYTTLVEKLKSKSYDVYEEPYKLNIVGIRKKKPKIKDPEGLSVDGANPHNLFLDELVVFLKMTVD